MMPFKKHEKYAKIVVFTEGKEAKRDFSHVFFFWKSVISKNFYFKIWRVMEV